MFEDRLKQLQRKSKSFSALWKEMEGCFEDTQYHQGETTAEHTRRVYQNMKVLVQNLPEAERELMSLLALLHDIGKPAARITKNKIAFPGHEKESYVLAKKILEEIEYREKELLLALIKNHMRLFAAIQSNNVKSLIKDKVYPFISKLAIMAKADLLAIDKDTSEIDILVKKVHDLKNEKTKANKSKQKKVELIKKMSDDEFTNMLRKKGLPEKKIQIILQNRKKIQEAKYKAMIKQTIKQITLGSNKNYDH